MGLFASIGKLGTNAFSGLSNMVERFGSKPEFEGGMAAVVLVASADGSISDEEKSAALGLLATIPAFTAFGSTDVKRLFDEGAQWIGMDASYGREMLYDRIRAVKDPIARATIATIAFKIAAADGSIADSEKAVIDKIKAL